MSNYNKLKELCEQIDSLICARVRSSSPAFKDWKAKVKLQLAKFGEESIQYKSWSKIHFSPMAYFDETDYVTPCREGLESAKSLLEAILEDMEESEMKVTKFDMSKIFIVHGHDDNLKNKVARLLEQQGIEAIILHEQPNAGKTIIEKIERYSNVGAAIILFTPDDTGKANKDTEYSLRARQNVVFEAGYFIGYLGRDRIVPLVTDSSIELPSDLQGMVYTSGNSAWQYEVIDNLKELGFNVSKDKVKC